MSFCQKCGFQLPDGAMFCSRCGAQLGAQPMPQQPMMQQAVPMYQPAERMITVQRKGTFGTDPMGVYIDDGEYAILRHGESKTFPIPAGMHRMQIRATSHSMGKGGMTVGQGNKNSYSSDVIYIRETDGNLTFSASMNMFGKITVKPM